MRLLRNRKIFKLNHLNFPSYKKVILILRHVFLRAVFFYMEFTSLILSTLYYLLFFLYLSLNEVITNYKWLNYDFKEISIFFAFKPTIGKVCDHSRGLVSLKFEKNPINRKIFKLNYLSILSV